MECGCDRRRVAPAQVAQVGAGRREGAADPAMAMAMAVAMAIDRGRARPAMATVWPLRRARASAGAATVSCGKVACGCVRARKWDARRSRGIVPFWPRRDGAAGSRERNDVAAQELDAIDPQAPDAPPPALQPLAYHRELVAYFKRAEAEVWAWAASLEVQQRHAEELRAQLLRQTYRLDEAAHPRAHALCALALQRLELDARVVLYQAGDGAMGASLWHLPGEAHVVLAGAVLERLDEAELLALLGHELAHYKLWSADGGDYLIARRILDHCLADPQAAPSHLESARRYSLHTEIYADRGAALAAGAAIPAVAILVKVHTGLGSVDPVAYLRQAEEIERGDARPSQGESHPESYLRAQALERWWRGADDGDGDGWLRRRLQGPLSLRRADLPDQLALQTLTRRFLARALQAEGLRGDAAQQQARAYFPDWGENEPAAGDDELSEQRIDASVRDYLHSVLLDLALADPDQREAAVLDAARIAARMRGREDFLATLKRDAGYLKRDLAKLTRELDRELDRESAPGNGPEARGDDGPEARA